MNKKHLAVSSLVYALLGSTTVLDAKSNVGRKPLRWDCEACGGTGSVRKADRVSLCACRYRKTAEQEAL